MNCLRSRFSQQQKARMTESLWGCEAGVPIPFPSYHFVQNPTSQCLDPTDYANKKSIPFSFLFLMQIPVPVTQFSFSSAKTGKSQFSFFPFRNPHECHDSRSDRTSQWKKNISAENNYAGKRSYLFVCGRRISLLQINKKENVTECS